MLRKCRESVKKVSRNLCLCKDGSNGLMYVGKIQYIFWSQKRLHFVVSCRLKLDSQGCLMSTQIEAVYENGILRPLNSLLLSDQQRVTVTIEVPTDSPDAAHFALHADQWDAFCVVLDAPAKVILPLRKLLSEPSVFDGPVTTP